MKNIIIKPPRRVIRITKDETTPPIVTTTKRIVSTVPNVQPNVQSTQDQPRDFYDEAGIADHISFLNMTQLLLRRDVPGLIKALYTHKPNQCVKYNPTKQIFEIFTDHRWVESRSIKVRELVETAYRVFRRFFDKNTHGIYEFWYQEYKEEPYLYKIDIWLEDLWNEKVDNISSINKSIIKALTQ